jgi:hypothetical protein
MRRRRPHSLLGRACAERRGDGAHGSAHARARPGSEWVVKEGRCGWVMAATFKLCAVGRSCAEGSGRGGATGGTRAPSLLPPPPQLTRSPACEIATRRANGPKRTRSGGCAALRSRCRCRIAFKCRQGCVQLYRPPGCRSVAQSRISRPGELSASWGRRLAGDLETLPLTARRAHSARHHPATLSVTPVRPPPPLRLARRASRC